LPRILHEYFTNLPEERNTLGTQNFGGAHSNNASGEHSLGWGFLFHERKNSANLKG